MNRSHFSLHERPSRAAAKSRPEALGQSEAFLAFQERLSKVARIDRPVLLVGERGTGKELAAAKLHYLSARWQCPFLALNCAALSPALIESELFGYEAGAFTGALRRRSGRFEVADGGTLFLDEIANTPPEVQEKILRVVEYGTFERVGSPQSITVDVRIIGATNTDLPALVQEGRFKQDLLDRLSFEILLLPPLRERKGDIPLLVNHFAARMAFEMGHSQVPEFSDEALTALENYAWPGNVRELKNAVERAVYLANGPLIEQIVFDPFWSPFSAKPAAGGEDIRTEPKDAQPVQKNFRQATRELEIRLMKQAMEVARYNQRKAAQILGLTYHQFRGIYRKYKTEI
jgi:psp operon transcriptional activator